ncbi:MAG: hypothetical protein CMI53_03555 [Parcubacteria group bacterium]|nr:hypothetical protein [Parcubacteria group bacterium]
MFLARKKKKKTKKLILLAILVIFIGWFYYYYSANTPVSSSSEMIEFIVEPGWGSTKISQELKAKELIRSERVFQYYAWRTGLGSRLQDGEYFLNKNLNIKEIAQILSRGAGATKEITLTFIEGWSNEEIAGYLEEKGIAQSKEFFAVIQKKADWWDSYDFLISRPRSADLEGYLFPDTYRVFRDASIKDIVQKMLDNFDTKLTDDIQNEIKRQGKTIHDILTLASIIEKEVANDKDRKIVADIFYKRLEAGVALQADSTVNYASGASNARSSAKDLEIDSLYNTYKYRGLPPGPITNPSLSSILAAVYPEKNPYWYFLTTPKGEAIYNVTFEEHIEDKNKYY